MMDYLVWFPPPSTSQADPRQEDESPAALSFNDERAQLRQLAVAQPPGVGII